MVRLTKLTETANDICFDTALTKNNQLQLILTFYCEMHMQHA